jgi:quercetin dioxygenase-like cupin family protein
MATTAPCTIEWGGTTYRILLTGAQTRDQLGIFESLDQPGYGPPRHIHQREDETFHIQSGQVEFWVNGRTSLHDAGSVIFVPRGTAHAFRVIGDRPARMVTIMTPGGFEGFFAEVAEKNCRVPEDMDVLAEIGRRFNVVFVGPPLGAA